MDLHGKLALVTGASSGIGHAAALKLAAHGADIALLGRTREPLEEVAQALREMGRQALVVTADISNDDDMRSAHRQIADAFGRLDIVFANAGINGNWAPIEDLTYEEWRHTQSVNLGGTFLTLHHAIPLMKTQGGSIIITSSINGTRTFTTAGASAYAASKAGQVGLAQMAALELARHAIRVNVICPGAIETPIHDKTKQRNVEAASELGDYPDGTIPLTRGEPGHAEDVADLVVFLASDRSRHITGTPIWIDGGQSLLV